jgi:FAD dependent oxidoreductase TIGR03364
VSNRINRPYDDAVVGAGILGLAHAYHLAKRGRRVIVFERSAAACGASIRNFGMIWPIGQPEGPMRALAERSRDIWLDVLADSRLWHERVGSLHLAYHDDEAQVLNEFIERARSSGRDVEWFDPSQVIARSPAVRRDGLRGALWSAGEVCVDPRQAIAGLPGWLTRQFGVEFQFGRAVTKIDGQTVFCGGAAWDASRIWICSGDDLASLFPETLGNLGLIRCKLQMMRSQAFGDSFRLGPMLAAGSTLRHYKSFDGCPSLAAVRERFSRDFPAFDEFGIHVMASQHGSGEITIGDSHEYGDRIEPFDKTRIDDRILEYLATFLNVPGLKIDSRWHGIYVKHPADPYKVAKPAEGVTAITGLGGAGMTLSFGLAEQVVTGELSEDQR